MADSLQTEAGLSRVALAKQKKKNTAPTPAPPPLKGKQRALDQDQNDAPDQTTAAPTPTTFAALGLSPSLVRALAHLSITTPTPIQALTIPAILSSSSSSSGKRDIIGGAQTGSGKTLCFALPILQALQKDLVCGLALVLTPTRELAVQLHEQFLAVAQGVGLSSSSSSSSSTSSAQLNCSLVVGGMDHLAQSRALANSKPHVVIATPGRLVDLLRTHADLRSTLLRRCRYVVLDEADRLLTQSFAPELQFLFAQESEQGGGGGGGCLPRQEERQTLLFTATLTEAIERLIQRPSPSTTSMDEASSKSSSSKSSGKKPPPLVFKIEQPTTTPAQLRQRYLLVPSHMREPYLYHLLRHSPALPAVVREQRRSVFHDDDDDGAFDSDSDDGNDDESEEAGSQTGSGSGSDNTGSDSDSDSATEPESGDPGYDTETDDADPSLLRARLQLTPTIIFVNRSSTAEHLSRTLAHLGLPNAALHSQLPQAQRFAALARFRASRVPLLIATDVGSRGLDVPEVSCVVNYDVPAGWEDYVHRVGRTARNGRAGWAVSLVTERDVQLVQGIEARIGVRMRELKGYGSTASAGSSSSAEDGPRSGANATARRRGHKTAEEKIVERLNRVLTAKRTAKLEMQEERFGEAREGHKRKRLLLEGGGGGAGGKEKGAKKRKDKDGKSKSKGEKRV